MTDLKMIVCQDEFEPDTRWLNEKYKALANAVKFESAVHGTDIPGSYYIENDEIGDSFENEFLPLTFVLDDDYKNFIFFRNWLKELGEMGTPKNYLLLVSENLDIKVIFEKAFPVSLTPLELIWNSETSETRVFTVTMKFKDLYFV